jgi:hypothetical protein
MVLSLNSKLNDAIEPEIELRTQLPQPERYLV